MYNKISNENPSDTSLEFSKMCSSGNNADVMGPNSATAMGSTITSNNYLQIYWPNSEDWDGVTSPVIAFAPEDFDSLSATGFVVAKNGEILKQMNVNEEYCESHPVWIINESDIPYSSLPNFKKGENLSSDGICFVNNKADDSAIVNASNSNPVYTWKATSMTVKHQYDSWINGASEIDIQVAYPQIAGYSGGITYHRLTFKRKDIKKKRKKNLTDIFLNTNWRPEQITNYLLITESDGGSDVDIKVDLTHKDPITGLEVNTTVTMEKKSRDELIAKIDLDRDFVAITPSINFDNGNVEMEMTFGNN